MFIELTTKENEKILVNTNQVQEITAFIENDTIEGTVLSFTYDNAKRGPLVVVESYAVIKEMLTSRYKGV